jgi:hypothetical protein
MVFGDIKGVYKCCLPIVSVKLGMSLHNTKRPAESSQHSVQTFTSTLKMDVDGAK